MRELGLLGQHNSLWNDGTRSSPAWCHRGCATMFVTTTMKEGRECTPVRTFDRRQTIDCVRGRRQYFMSLATIPVVIVINIYRRRCGVAVVTVKSHVYYFTSQVYYSNFSTCLDFSTVTRYYSYYVAGRFFTHQNRNSFFWRIYVTFYGAFFYRCHCKTRSRQTIVAITKRTTNHVRPVKVQFCWITCQERDVG